MRSILEKAIVHLLNEEHDQAQALFHKFMVERARQIHESLRNGDDAVLNESFNEAVTEEYYDSNDLDGVEDSPEGDMPVAGDDMGAPEGDDMGGMGAPEGDDMGGDDTGMDDMGGGDDDMGVPESDDMGGEGDIAGDLADIKDQLASLTAEFEKLMGSDDSGDDLGGGDDMGAPEGDDMGGDFGADSTDGVEDDMTDDAGSETDMGADADADMDSEDDKPSFGEGEEKSLDEEFDDITESIVSELEKIAVTMTDGKEIAAGKSFSQNNKSVGLQKKPNPTTDGKPVQIKADEHKGFERETAPSVKDMKKRRNTKNSADDGRSSVSKEGDKAALINKDFGKGGEANTKSPLAKR